MCGKKMRVCFAVLCLSTVCVLVVGCEGIATKAPTCSVKRLGPYELDADGFVTNWLVVGPFPNPGERPDNKGFHVDYLKKYGGETNYVPADGAEIAKDDGTKVKWAQYKPAYGSRIDFFSVDHLDLGYVQDDILTYSACWLECERDMNIQIRVGSDDGYKLWVDHKLVGEEHVYRSAYQDQENYPIKLSKGMHLVLIKVDQDYGSFEFMLRVTTPGGRKASGVKVWN